jgi:hypothetical protein
MDTDKNRANKPERIFHYTSFDVLESILRTQTLRASNASYLNDKRELIHAFEAAQQALSTKKSTGINEKWINAFSAVLGELESNGLGERYITCFCKASDSLTMWRGYAQHKQGVSIGFKTRRLESWAKAFRPDFTDVIYGNVSTASKVKNFLMKSVEDLVEWEKMIGEFTEVELQYEANKIVKRMLPRFKHWGFRDEREFRAIFERKDEDKQGMMVRTASVVPFIEVKNENAALPIESIMIGPSPDGEFTQKSVEALLKMYGFSKVKVALSAVPFRVQV